MSVRSVPVLLGLLLALLALASCGQGAAVAPTAAERSPAVLAGRSAPPPDIGTEASPAASAPDTPASSSVYPPDLPRAVARASWVLYPTFAEVIAKADLFVVGTVTAVSPGSDAGSKFPLPTTVSEIDVSEVGRGSMPGGGVIKVQQTGGVYRPVHAREDAKLSPAPLPADAPEGVEPLSPGTPPERLLLEVDDDPLFRPGERVALALRWVPEFGVYQLVNPQGRFAIGEDGRVTPILADDAAVKGLSGLSVGDLLEQVRILTQ